LAFFATTHAYRRSHTDVFDFITPTAAAMWNLRWQVAGFLAAAPNATKDDLDGRFLAGSGIRSANVRRAAVDHTWDQQLEQFARFSLYVFVALYEGWLATTLALFPKPAQLVKEMQFPSRRTRGKPSSGVRHAIDLATRSRSSLMRRAFAAPLRAQRRYSLTKIDELLVCYRYFKECRNSLLHGAGLASRNLKQSADAMGGLSVSSLGTRAMPEYFPFALGDPVTVTLRGVVGFSEVVLRIVTTIDAELALTQQGETEFFRRWKSVYRYEMLPADTTRRLHRIEAQTMNAGFPRPYDPGVLDRALRDARLIM
jgi:hypothetical protein